MTAGPVRARLDGSANNGQPPASAANRAACDAPSPATTTVFGPGATAEGCAAAACTARPRPGTTTVQRLRPIAIISRHQRLDQRAVELHRSRIGRAGAYGHRHGPSELRAPVRDLADLLGRRTEFVEQPNRSPRTPSAGQWSGSLHSPAAPAAGPRSTRSTAAHCARPPVQPGAGWRPQYRRSSPPVPADRSRESAPARGSPHYAHRSVHAAEAVPRGPQQPEPTPVEHCATREPVPPHARRIGSARRPPLSRTP